MTYRIEISPKKQHLHKMDDFEYTKKKVIYLTHPELTQDIVSQITKNILSNNLTENFELEATETTSQYFVDKKFKFGVTDNTANAIKESIHYFFPKKNLEVTTGELFLFNDKNPKIKTHLLGNHLLHNFTEGSIDSPYYTDRFKSVDLGKVEYKFKKAKILNFTKSIEELEEWNIKNCWALNRNELQTIKDYFMKGIVSKQRNEKGISADPTDVEIEIIAQTWSEHCKHKIFQAKIDYSEPADLQQKKIGNQKIENLFKEKIVKASTDTIEKHKIPWAISLFKDNAGIVRFDDKIDLCAKVETHNSPSALDPYGGALTGILGVNRDILGCGMGALPIANTNVFCVGSMENMHKVYLPSNLLSPKTILNGVHKGVKDGGNKSGIPTVNGAITFDDDYMGKPLVYCGTIGVLPQTVNGKPSAEKPYKKGDLIYMIGGRVGMDGIHGATFSSLELDENSPSSAVQIGDPLTQKRVTDFLMHAQREGLYSGITDNGAGGLSSSVGEMAEETNGATLDLAKVPLKYPGLSPFQIMVSESQERMTLAVPTINKDKFETLSRQYNIESTAIGKFTDTGYLDIYYGKEIVAYLNLEFLHNGCPQLELKAEYQPETQRTYWHGEDFRVEVTDDHRETLITMLSRPNIRSKDHYVRQYDQEVRASTIIKPFNGRTQKSPSDSGLVWLKNYGGNEKAAVAISCGINPKLSYYDTYEMTLQSVDEAVRNLITLGADPKKISLLDNFCWADPVETANNPEGPHRLAQLVRSAQALYDACTTYGAPLISGKDSMKNNFSDPSGVKIAVPPTLLVTAMGYVPDIDKSTTTAFKNPDDKIYFLSPYTFEENFSYTTISEFTQYYKTEAKVPICDLDKNFDLYKNIYQAHQSKLFNSCHDVSEGGIVTSVLESCFGNHLGAILENNVPDRMINACFYNEMAGSFIVSVSPDKENELLKAFPTAKQLGIVTSGTRLKFFNQDKEYFDLSLLELENYWRNDNEF